MVKCPFCHYDNEDGALFCERCSSDLSGVASAPPAPPPIPVAEPEPEPMPIAFAEPLAEPMPLADPIPMAFADPIPAAAPLEPIPVAEPEPIAPPRPTAPPPPPVVSMPPAPPVPPPAPAPAPTAPPPAPAAVGAAPGPLPAGAQPRLQVLRGQKRNVEYPIYEGLNYIGRADEKPVDIDLEEQEPPDRIWCSRQHAVITFEGGMVSLEDLNSANGTYVNRVRVYPGQAKPLAVNDIVQIGNVQMKLVV
jgi:hypothetical protein